jgi:predicted nucleic acid-binding protein
VAAKAVIDSNVWISSLLNPIGFPAQIRKAFVEGAFTAVVSEPILEEIAHALARESGGSTPSRTKTSWNS